MPRRSTGVRQLVFVTGEAGIGKTTVVDAFLAQVEHGAAGVDRARAVHRALRRRGSVSAAAGGYGAAGPGAERGAAGGRPAAVCPDLAGAAARSGGGGGGAPPAPGGTPQRMLRELAEALEALTAVQPLVLVLEDVHWGDAATVEALAWLARRRDTARLLLFATYRPVELRLRQHPLQAGAAGVTAARALHRVALGPLPVAAVQAYVAQRGLGAEAPTALAAWVHRRPRAIRSSWCMWWTSSLTRGGGAAGGRGRGRHPGGLAAAHRAAAGALRCDGATGAGSGQCSGGGVCRGERGGGTGLAAGGRDGAV